MKRFALKDLFRSKPAFDLVHRRFYTFDLLAEHQRHIFLSVLRVITISVGTSKLCLLTSLLLRELVLRVILFITFFTPPRRKYGTTMLRIVVQ